jgi:hypothetical protein
MMSVIAIFRQRKIDGITYREALRNGSHLEPCGFADCRVGCASAVEFCRQINKQRTEPADATHPTAQKRRKGKRISHPGQSGSSPSESLRGLWRGGSKESLLQILRCRGFQREHGAGRPGWSFPPQNSTSQGSNFQTYQRPRCCEHVVGPIQAAQLAKRGMLYPENPATTQGGQGSGNIGGLARFEALRRAGSRRPTPTASAALGNVGGAGGGVVRRSLSVIEIFRQSPISDGYNSLNVALKTRCRSEPCRRC